MAIEVRIPKEIMEYKEKIIFGLSIRQLLCFTIAIVSGVGIYILTKNYMGTDIASYLSMFAVMPVLAIGFIRKDGFTFEKYMALMFRHRFGIKKRIYKTELLIDDLNWENEKHIKRRGEKNVTTISKKERATNNSIREGKIFKVTKKDRKRKSKEAYREIKAAQQEYRTAK